MRNRLLAALALGCALTGSPCASAAGGGLATAYGRARTTVKASLQKTRQRRVAGRSSLSLGRCALGPVGECFGRLLIGLMPEDRSFVHLAGQEVLVDASRQSQSTNFETLQRAANQADGRVLIEVLDPRQSFSIRQTLSWPSSKLDVVSMPMGAPRTQSGFEGYTFFQYRGKIEDGIIYSPGAYTLVEINTEPLKGDTVTESIHHELRHVVLGDFGRSAPKAAHGLAPVEQATSQAEQEAKRYEQSLIAL